MKINARFEKVSWKVFADCGNEQTYNGIRLPCRSTKCSAGYDFWAPVDISLLPRQSVTVATGVRAVMPDDVCLLILPRSGLGFKYRLRLDNTVGVIDADYANSANEGHIFVKLTNEGDKPLIIANGTAFAQGIFVHYLVTEDDEVTTERNGGLGSTTAWGTKSSTDK